MPEKAAAPAPIPISNRTPRSARTEFLHLQGEQGRCSSLAINRAQRCHSTGSAIATTIRVQSLSSLAHPSFTPICVLPLLSWIKASSPKATSLIARCEYRKRFWATAIAGKSKERSSPEAPHAADGFSLSLRRQHQLH